MRDEVRTLLIPLFLLVPACAAPPPTSSPEPAVIWQQVGSWSGSGDWEESFPASSGYLRFTWETSNETKPGEGRFKLILGSSISGRPIQVVAERKGASHAVAYVSEDPRTFYLKVESASENWKLTVDEGFSATLVPKR